MPGLWRHVEEALGNLGLAFMLVMLGLLIPKYRHMTDIRAAYELGKRINRK
jgi:hypothetical protein